MKSLYLTILGVVFAVGHSQAAEFSINDALREAAKSHPGVGEAAANRRATESELRPGGMAAKSPLSSVSCCSMGSLRSTTSGGSRHALTLRRFAFVSEPN